MAESSTPVGEWVAIDDLTPWNKNPRINDHAVDQVAKSIIRFGWGAPILARKEDRVVIAGHTRLKAAKSLGLDKVPVRFLDLDPAQAAALALADNKLGEIADWQTDQLTQIMAELAADEIDLSGLGWSDEELTSLLSDPDAVLPDEADPDSSGDDDRMPTDAPALTQPGDVIEIGNHTIHCLDCVQMLKSLPDNSVDAIVTDPPYGIGFMGEKWDAAVPGDVFAAECLRVLKPGAHMVAFAATKTVHRLTVNLEDAGFEIRDMISWLQWQGFPKSHDVSKAIDKKLGAERTEPIGKAYSVPNAKTVNPHFVAIADQRAEGNKTKMYQPMAPASEEAKRWSGYGTALKPAQEPAILVRKPLEGTVAENVLRHGTGGLNIDGCRIAEGDPSWPGPNGEIDNKVGQIRGGAAGLGTKTVGQVITNPPNPLGRWPANIYFCPKPSRSEKEKDMGDAPKIGAGSYEFGRDGSLDGRKQPLAANHHPTVKPIGLMRWLARLLTPRNGLLVEPFGGSGTTILAAEREGFRTISSEIEPKYCDIIRARLTAVCSGSVDG